ncbi:MAG: TonB-dependent receptor [Cytophagales bacterium]|nr:TonB-dependent receptor [Cytophagales bacterium]
MKSKLLRQVVSMSKKMFYGFTLCCICYSAIMAEDLNAQILDNSIQDIYITIDVTKVPVKKVLDKIENETGFSFAYNSEKIDLDYKISLNCVGTDLASILMQISRDAGLKFKRINNYIHIGKRETDESIKIEEKFNEQNISISGRVTDEYDEGLPGVNILVQGTSIGTVTDVEGNYKLGVPNENALLVFSSVGYVTEEIEVGNNTIIDMVMTPDLTSLEEIVVVGYGVQKKKDVTGSIASVESGQIEARPIASFEEAMQGLIAGVNVVQRSASPGELGTVSVRALGSITAGTSPLWVVDGFPTDQRNAQAINPADIESVEILKDASATAIYGSRGANGVIIITTKSGQEGKSVLNLSIIAGSASVPEGSRMEVLNAEEYVQFHTEANGGSVPDWITDVWDGTTDTDWQDLVFRSAPYQNYAISGSGGSKKVSYLLSANYLDQQGVIIGEKFRKYSTRLKVDYRPSDNITIGMNLAPNFTTTQRRSPATPNVDWSSLYAQALMMAPILPVRRADGTFSMNSDFGGFPPVGNPLETFENYDHQTDRFRFLGGIYGRIEIVEGLTLYSSFSTTYGTNKSETYYLPTVGQDNVFQLPAVSQFSTSQNQQFGWLNENTINYKKEIGDHSFDVLGGFTLQKDNGYNVNARVNELQVPGIRNVNIGNVETLQGGNSSSSNSLVSYLARLNYGLKGKYLLTATVRTDGSSRFGSNKRYQTFGSFALGWRFSEEVFMEGLDFLSNGKLRVSYGSTGSNSIRDFDSRATMNSVRHAFGSNAIFGTTLGLPGNDNLTWETSTQFDIGLDVGFINNRFNLIFDYYDNETTTLLLTKNVVPSSGYSSFLTNIGSMRNKGVELTIDAQIIDSQDWRWSIGGNLTFNDQEILDLGGEQEIQNFFGALRRVVGGELQQIRGPKVIGIAREGEDFDGVPLGKAGAYRYEDVDGDGSISNFLGADGQLIGDTNIDYIYGINTSLSYKNFDLSVLFNGQSGAYVYDFWLLQVAAPFRNVNLSKEYWYDGRYIDENNPGDGKTPAAGSFNDGIAPVSSAGVQKTDFLRIRNVTLSYNLPTTFLSKLHMTGGRIFTSVENLHTFTKFVGGNPEARRVSAGGPALIGGSQIAEVTDGRELGLNSPPGLPLPRTWTIGLNVNF